MSESLLSIALGPVQDFIAAARRTRDLWFGSYLLSEISKASAAALHHAGAVLIFPSVNDAAADLKPDSPLNVANKILVRLDESLDPAILAETAKLAAVRRWEEFADAALTMSAGAIQKDLWDEQVNDVIEFYAAWVHLDGNYAEARARVERLLAGRKRLRDFIPAKGRPGVPKSSLDGARESVLKDPAKLGTQARLRAMLKENEHLDCVGLVKRLAGDPERFPSVARIAADPWIREVSSTPKGRDFLKSVGELCDPSFTSRLHDPIYQEFPWEGEILFLGRRSVLLSDPEVAPYRSAIGKIQELFQAIRPSEPSPYLALVSADGDRMGAALASLPSPEEHGKLSNLLARFAREAARIVRSHHGSLIYSGGDDVLAFVPLDLALPCARSLHDEFSNILGTAGITEAAPTLSVGIAIGHCQELLEDLLRQVRQAEKSAKAASRPGLNDERNGLALALTTRGAETLTWRRSWQGNPDGTLAGWIGLIRSGTIPDKLAYDLRTLSREYCRMVDSGAWKQIPSEALQRDVRRLIRRKRTQSGTELPEDLLVKLLTGIESPEDVDDLSRALIIARRLAEAQSDAASREEGQQ